MEEDIRGKLFPILVLLTLIFFITTVKSCSGINKQKNMKDKEMYARLEAEEKLQDVKKGWDLQLIVKDKELKDEKSAHEATKNLLDQERLINKDLKEELDKVTKVKEVLEEELKDVLVNSKLKTKK
ncbi:MAG: hypothetical protein ABH882_03320 [Candidatus Omnitrophota bacterium]|nr:hypothetical protein [Candidatus Omnitrophota bacterium]MBU1929603.1 hypothetical protein [Candidatus Omnitrophota bacterium]MBU2034796.1 hypothetical protein [Candidatus Omnitrophota bacterium]MBU2222286.1 hypothetical protein [Candidatus Omnitrophota bacterium]MBU2257858.1 hypothetical protein [Candidatus Omnitrophota bacterium]